MKTEQGLIYLNRQGELTDFETHLENEIKKLIKPENLKAGTNVTLVKDGPNVTINSSGATAAGIPEAPTDGQQYARQNAGWTVVMAGQGIPGKDGKSAYQTWLDEGNTGSEQDFLDSLKGEPGADGEKGDPGQDGKDGKKGDSGGVTIPLNNGLVTLFIRDGHLWARTLPNAVNPFRIEDKHLIIRLPKGVSA